MSSDGWFRRRHQAGKKAQEVPDGLWAKCPGCQTILFAPELEKNLRVCSRCGHHYRLSWQERIAITADEGTFSQVDEGVGTSDPLSFPDYEQKLAKGRAATGLEDGFVTGEAAIGGRPVLLGVSDFSFMGGSMGSAAGEKVVRLMERAVEKRLPVVLFTASGGARMQEGLLSLMQMARTSGAAAKMMDAGLLYVVVFTDPTMAGVHASYASVGDVIISEPGALVGFAGQRVAAQAQVVKVPHNFQKAEFQLEHGMVDMVVQRKEMRDTLARIIKFATEEAPVA